MFAGYSELFTVLENNDVENVSNDTAKVIFEINIPNDLKLIKSIEAKIHEIESYGNSDYESSFDEEHSKNRQFAIIKDFTIVQNPKDSAQKLINEISEIMKLPGMPLYEKRYSIITIDYFRRDIFVVNDYKSVYNWINVLNKQNLIKSNDTMVTLYKSQRYDIFITSDKPKSIISKRINPIYKICNMLPIHTINIKIFNSIWNNKHDDMYNLKPRIIPVIYGLGAEEYCNDRMSYYNAKFIDKCAVVKGNNFTNIELDKYILEILKCYNDPNFGYDVLFVSAHGAVLKKLTEYRIPFTCIEPMIYNDLCVDMRIINKMIFSNSEMLHLNELISYIEYRCGHYIPKNYYKLEENVNICNRVLDKIIKG